MATIASVANTYNLANYGGPLYLVTPDETPFLTTIGNMSNLGETADATQFEWQTEALRAPAQPAIVEGAPAPTASSTTRQNFDNLVQIFQYTFGVTYTKQAATGQKSGVNNGQSNPITDEVAHQAQIQLINAARDMNHTFINGVYNKPSDNTTARQTRGLLSAISTNVTDLASAPLSKVAILDMLQGVWNTHGISQSYEPTLMCNATVKRSLTHLFITGANYQEVTRDVGGVSLSYIVTDFGRINIMVDRAMPTTTLAMVHLKLCRPRFLVIPGKGFLFVEPLAKTGAFDSYQLYGEAGLEYGPEQAHGKMLNVGAVAGA